MGSQSQIPTDLSDAKPWLYTGWLMFPAEWTAGLIPALPHSLKLSRWLPGNGISVPCLPCSRGSSSFWPPKHTVVSQVEDCVSRLGDNKLQEFLNSEEPEKLFSCKSSEMLLNEIHRNETHQNRITLKNRLVFPALNSCPTSMKSAPQMCL